MGKLTPKKKKIFKGSLSKVFYFYFFFLVEVREKEKEKEKERVCVDW